MEFFKWFINSFRIMFLVFNYFMKCKYIISILFFFRISGIDLVWILVGRLKELYFEEF